MTKKKETRAWRWWILIAALLLLIGGGVGATYTYGWKMGLALCIGVAASAALIFFTVIGVAVLLTSRKEPEVVQPPPKPLPAQKKEGEENPVGKRKYWRWVIYPCAIGLALFFGWWVGPTLAVIHLFFLLALTELGAKWCQAEPKSFRRDLLLAAFVLVLMFWAIPTGISLGRLNDDEQAIKQSQKTQRSIPLLSGEENNGR